MQMSSQPRAPAALPQEEAQLLLVGMGVAAKNEKPATAGNRSRYFRKDSEVI
jgi:hypothetical protein